MLALVDRRPQVVNLKQMLEAFVRFRREIVTRRTRYDLARAEERAHILAGLRKAVEQLDLVIRIIRQADERGGRPRHLDGPAGSDGDPGQGHPRHAAPPAGRPRAAEDRGGARANLKVDRGAEEHPRLRGQAHGAHPRRAAGHQGGVRRRPAHGDPRRDDRSDHRGPARRRGDGGLHHPVGLHQAHPRGGLPQPAARRQGRDGHGNQGRGPRRGPLRGLHPLVAPVLHQPRQGALAQGARDARGRAPGQGQGHGQSPVPGRGRARGHLRARARLRLGQLRPLRHPQGESEEDGAGRPTRIPAPAASRPSAWTTATRSSRRCAPTASARS